MEEVKLTLSPLTKALIEIYYQSKLPTPSGVDKIRVSRTVSAAAFIVERIRNAIEFRDESLMRRAAIERILKRRLVLNERGEGIATHLIRELIWAKYLQNNGVPESMVGKVQAVIEIFLGLQQEVAKLIPRNRQAAMYAWILEVLSCALEETLAVTRERDGFISFVYQHLRTSIQIKDANETMENVQIYLAVSRALVKSDRALLRHELLKLLEPDFELREKKDLGELVSRFSKSIEIIDGYIHQPIGAKLYRYVRRISPPFLILRDILERGGNLASTLSDDTELKTIVWEMCGTRYQQTGKRLRRLAIRSIVYLFLTKMLFALIVEVPVDRAMHGDVALIPLAVNTTFPVLLMAFVALTNSPPGENNTERIYKRIREILVHVPSSSDHKTPFAIRQAVIRPGLTFFFTILYGIIFFIVFGGIIYLLNLAHFTLASQIIFIFFLCVVTFFGYQVHQTANEYRFEEREGLLTPLVDFLVLPILRVGQWLSSEVTAGVASIFTFIFDFFFEIPIKSFLEILEEWFSFIRSKKEELT